MKINEIVESREITNEVIPAVLGAVGRAGAAAAQGIGRAGAAAARGTVGAAQAVKQKSGAAGARAGTWAKQQAGRAGTWAKQQAGKEVDVPWEFQKYADPSVGIGRSLAGGFISGLTGRAPDPEELTPWKRKGEKTAPKQATPTTAPAPTTAPRTGTTAKVISGAVKDPKGGLYTLTPSGWVNALGQPITQQSSIDHLDRLYHLQRGPRPR